MAGHHLLKATLDFMIVPGSRVESKGLIRWCAFLLLLLFQICTAFVMNQQYEAHVAGISETSRMYRIIPETKLSTEESARLGLDENDDRPNPFSTKRKAARVFWPPPPELLLLWSIQTTLLAPMGAMTASSKKLDCTINCLIDPLWEC